MKFLVFGAGAIGQVVGGLLAKSGESVTLYGRAKYLDYIKQNGLRITGIWGEHLIQSLDCVTELTELANHEFDYILLTVKSFDTEGAVTQFAPLVTKNTLVVSLQNGLGNWEIISAKLGKEKVVGARVIFGAAIPEPGLVKVTVYAEETMLGPIQQDIPNEIYKKIELLVQRLTQAGIPAKLTKEITGYLWQKVMYNSALNPLSALLGMTYGEIAENRYARTIMVQVIQEIYLVAQAYQIKLIYSDPEKYFEKFFSHEVPSTAPHRSSMLQAIEAGKRVDIDALNGAIVKLAKQKNIPVPVNEILTFLIKAKETAVQKEGLNRN
ncbi:MAG: ketopantoate reductase family protein [bacterium]|nr:ketopantoate reductase family protein [bacterium]